MAIDRFPVVVGVDGSIAGLGAARWAADEAVRLGQPLTITRVVDRLDAAGEPTDEHRTAFDMAAQCRQWQPGLHVTAEVRSGTPAAVLVEYSARASLLVVANRGYGGFQSLVAGSVGTHLAAYARCPVLVVHRAQLWAGPEAVMPRHRSIVVGVDGSEADSHALSLAFDEAEYRGVPLVAVRAWHDRRRLSGVDPALSLAGATDRLAADLDPFRSKFPTVNVHPHVVEEAAATALLSAARDALMIVLGARGHSVCEELRLDAVTSHVLHRTLIPVLIARSDRWLRP